MKSTSVCNLAPERYPDADLIWVRRCNVCGRHWLRVLYEEPAISRSGHWYDALLPESDDLTATLQPDIKDIFLQASTKFQGGSYWDGKIYPLKEIPKRLV